ncbi:MAG TPA: hypothetical protein VGG39_11755 [Polyangiaceae bacterium]
MAYEETAARQFSFRLPEPLVERLERCRLHLCSSGLDVTRADVVRLLLNHALDATKCRIDLLLGRAKTRSRGGQ